MHRKCRESRLTSSVVERLPWARRVARRRRTFIISVRIPMHDIAPLHIALIIGSTRPDRFADIPARWIADGIAERDDITLEVLDLRDYRLPFFGEPHATNA